SSDTIHLPLQPQRRLHPARIAIDIVAQLKLARFIYEGSEVFKINREGFRQIDIALLAADHFLDPLLAPAIVAAEYRFSETERVVDTHASMAERPFCRGEQLAQRRIVHIDGEIVRKHKFDPPQRIAFAGRLAHDKMARA